MFISTLWLKSRDFQIISNWADETKLLLLTDNEHKARITRNNCFHFDNQSYNLSIGNDNDFRLSFYKRAVHKQLK